MRTSRIATALLLAGSIAAAQAAGPLPVGFPGPMLNRVRQGARIGRFEFLD